MPIHGMASLPHRTVQWLHCRSHAVKPCHDSDGPSRAGWPSPGVFCPPPRAQRGPEPTEPCRHSLSCPAARAGALVYPIIRTNTVGSNKRLVWAGGATGRGRPVPAQVQAPGCAWTAAMRAAPRSCVVALPCIIAQQFSSRVRGPRRRVTMHRMAQTGPPWLGSDTPSPRRHCGGSSAAPCGRPMHEARLPIASVRTRA